MVEKKIFSIAPSFSCKLKCDGCYLTTGVTKEMREATKNEYYFKTAIEEAWNHGYNEFAITWNPYPGSLEMTKQYVVHAKKLGFITSVTTTIDSIPEIDIEFAENIDIISISIDDLHGFKRLEELEKKFGSTPYQLYEPPQEEVRKILNKNKVICNINLLWTPGVFKWLFDGDKHFEQLLKSIRYPNTIQHLIYKPLSLYPSEKWFWENYKRVVEDYPWVNISGSTYEHIGDIALNNHMGINNCPGEDYQMIDIDPMGYARRCPENPTSYDARVITQLIPLLKEGTPCKKDKCNCIV